MERPERLSLECESLDELLGGGIESGVVTNVYGEAGSGKTNLCIQAMVSCLARGDSAIFIDTEGGFSTERYLQMADDEETLDNVIVYDPTTFEEQKEVMRELEEKVEEEDASLVVVDSLVSLYRLNLNGDNAQEINTELSRQFSILSKIAREKDIPVLVTNQVYSQFDSQENVMVGRDIPAYWSKILLELEKEKSGKRTATLRKHRSRPEGISTEFYINEASLGSEPDENGGMKIF